MNCEENVLTQDEIDKRYKEIDECCHDAVFIIGIWLNEHHTEEEINELNRRLRRNAYGQEVVRPFYLRFSIGKDINGYTIYFDKGEK